MRIIDKIKEFENKYLDKRFKIDWNKIRLSRADGYNHNLMVASICVWFLHNNINFATQPRFKSGYRPDIICFPHVKNIIEVRNTETERRTKTKLRRIPKELVDNIIYVDAKQKFSEGLIT